MFHTLQNDNADRWFRRLDAPLKRLPASERADIHREVHQHLASLAQAHEDSGSAPDEAWKRARRQFGDPGAFGKKMYQEWRQGRGRISPDLAAVLGGLGFYALSATGWVLIYCLLAVLGDFTFHGVRIDPSGWSYFVAVPIVTGLAVGRKYPHKGLIGTFYAALILLVLPLLLLALPALLAGVTGLSHPPGGGEMIENALELAGLAVSGLSLAVGTAYLASARQRRQWYRPQWADFALTLPRRWAKIA